MTIGERIKEVRDSEKMTLAAFGDRIGISNPAVSNIEKGKTNPSEQTIRAIVREFNVNEVWLRSGEGERDKKISRKEEIGLYVRKLLKGECSELEETLISFMANTSVDEWKMLTEMLKRLNEQYREKEKTETV